MCDGFAVFMACFIDPQEESLGIDSRGYRVVMSALEEDDDGSSDASV